LSKMKNVILLLVGVFIFSSCKKKKPTIDITLYNKPLATIQLYLGGKWKLAYEKGGICSTCLNYFNNFNYTWQFGSGNAINQTFNGAVFTDTTIRWIRDLGVYTGNDSTFIMNFYEKRLYPSSYVVDGIFNDSLQLHDNGSDPVYYHFSTSN
jgi:hypothetical protein